MSDIIPGILNDHDRRWKISGPELDAAITEYNWEVTGRTENLKSVVKYSDNAYWFLFTECPRRGWRVEELGR